MFSAPEVWVDGEKLAGMVHKDHVELLRKGIPSSGGVWADFGSGSGAFSLALAELIGPEGIIYAVDKDPKALQEAATAMRARFPDRPPGHNHYLHRDFTHKIDLPPLDGIIMANSLHFQKDKIPVIQIIYEYLKPGGRLLLVEYNVNRGNIWVPYPLSYQTWVRMASEASFRATHQIGSRPSHFLNEIYSAESLK